MNQGFLKLQRSPETWELLKDTQAFVLLTVIALRARRRDEFNRHGLQAGEALLGDHAKYGLSRQQYRTAMSHLHQWHLATFRPTTRGTVATLCDTRIYDINESGHNPPATNEPPTDNQPATTNKKEKKEKKETKYPAGSDERRLAELLWDRIREMKGDFRPPDLERWAVEIDRMLRRDGRPPERIEAVICWCQQDPFWRRNILSTAKLRQHFDRLELDMARHPPRESTSAQLARLAREDPL